MVDVTVDIPVSLRTALNREAIRVGETPSGIASKALAQYLAFPVHTLFQVSTTGALVEGVTAAAVTARTLLEHGDFGLGTFADLDGEMVVVDGCVDRVRGTGAVSEAAPGDAAPFAVVTRFEPEVDVPTPRVSSLEALAACREGAP